MSPSFLTDVGLPTKVAAKYLDCVHRSSYLDHYHGVHASMPVCNARREISVCCKLGIRSKPVWNVSHVLWSILKLEPTFADRNVIFTLLSFRHKHCSNYGYQYKA